MRLSRRGPHGTLAPVDRLAASAAPPPPRVEPLKPIDDVVQDGNAAGEVRRHRSKVLGKMTKGEATKHLRAIIDRECGGPGAAPITGDSYATFSWWWTKRYVPLCTWSKHTRANMDSLFRNHIEPRWGPIALADIAGVDVAAWLQELADEYSESLVTDCRTYLKAALQEAVEEDYLRKNPMRRVGLPEMREPSRPVVAMTQLKKLRAAIKTIGTLRDVVMFDVLVLTGVRPSEMLALRWEHYRRGADRALFIRQAFVAGELRKTKTKDSRNWVAIPAKLSREIDRYAASEDAWSSEWMFVSGALKPMSLDNWRKRVFAPAAAAAGVTVDLRTLRRSWATWAHEQGSSMKAVQAQLRHSSVTTTGDVYVQAVPKSVRDAVEGVAKKYF